MRFRLLGVLLAAAAGPAAAADAWPTYVNARYGFATCYPADLLKPQGEADNGDGQTFRARDGAELRVFGTNNVLDRSLVMEASAQAEYYTGPKGKITYRAAKRGWNVISGDDGAVNLFYTKTFARGDQFVMFQIKYPKSAAASYKGVVERLSRCFRP